MNTLTIIWAVIELAGIIFILYAYVKQHKIKKRELELELDNAITRDSIVTNHFNHLAL